MSDGDDNDRSGSPSESPGKGVQVPGRGELARIDGAEAPGEGDWLRFDFQDTFGRDTQGVLFRWRGKLHAFENICPHLGLPLDTHTGDIFDATGSALLCDSHGARFEPDSGLCTIGPCEGDRLTQLAVEVDEEDETIVISRRTSFSLST